MLKNASCKVLLIAVALTSVATPGFADDGRKRSMIEGALGGVAIGAIGATLLQQRQPEAAPDQRVVYVREEAPQPVCQSRPTRLFDAEGHYVKTERLEFCR